LRQAIPERRSEAGSQTLTHMSERRQRSPSARSLRWPQRREGDCATACANAGNPIAVLDDKATVYVAAGLKDRQTAQE